MTRLTLSLLLALLTAACADTGGTPRTDESTSESTSEPPVTPYVEVQAGPVGLTATQAAVWVVAARGEALQRIPVGATEPDLTVPLPGVPLRATTAFGSIWVTLFQGRKLLRLDPGTGHVNASLRTGEGPEGVTSGFGSVWVVVQDAGRLLRVDPETNQVAAELELAPGARLVTAGTDAMYVSHYQDGTVLRVDPATNAVTGRSTAACGGPQSMAELDGRVWVTCTVSGEVVALDGTTLQEVARVAVPGSPDTVAVTPDGRLAVVAEEGPRLVVLDPADGRVVGEQVLGQELGLYDQANLDLAFAGGEAWVSSFDADRVYHVPLLRSGASPPS